MKIYSSDFTASFLVDHTSLMVAAAQIWISWFSSSIFDKDVFPWPNISEVVKVWRKITFFYNWIILFHRKVYFSREILLILHFYHIFIYVVHQKHEDICIISNYLNCHLHIGNFYSLQHNCSIYIFKTFNSCMIFFNSNKLFFVFIIW